MSRYSSIDRVNICYKVHFEGRYHISSAKEVGDEQPYILYWRQNRPIKSKELYYARILHSIEGVPLLKESLTTKEFELTYAI